MFNVCSSFLDISSSSYEISKQFESEQSEEKESERETWVNWCIWHDSQLWKNAKKQNRNYF